MDSVHSNAQEWINLYLKKLEAFGFKSFAEKVKIEFSGGITAVVGPNGSGKSNITDAIRWVLGEQSAKALRGTKMEDIIFAGTDKRKPINVAEVTILLDNAKRIFPLDYNEVAITRRVYRSGENEYFINKNPCRLKDIQELFMDTGIGKGAYSIIGQGRIEEIINGRPEERRLYFEEAAGILRYKLRKREALRKLENTESNLVRISDLLIELEKQLTDLESQAAKTKRYKDLYDKLKKAEVTLYTWLIEESTNRFVKIGKEVEKLEGEISLKSKTLLELETKLEHCEAEVSVNYEKLEKLQEKISQEKNRLEKLQGDVKIAEEKFLGLVGQKNNLEEQQLNEERRLQKLREILREKEIVRSRLEADIAEDVQKLRAFEKQLKTVEESCLFMEADIEKKKNDLLEILNNAAQIRNENNSLRKEETQIQAKKIKMNDAVLGIEKRLEEQQTEIKNLTLRLEEVNERIESIRKKSGDLEKTMNECIKRLSSKEEAVTVYKEEVSYLNSQLTVLQQMEKDYEGYSSGVKAVMMKKEDFGQEICGTVADVITVPTKYETAIEIALGYAMQDVIVESEKTAQKIIDYLRKHHKGRVTFLPIDIIKAKDFRINTEIKNDPDFIACANQLVKFEPKYHGIIEFLLGKVLVMRNLDGAVRLAKKIKFQYKMVTLDGELIMPGGAITGGSSSQKKTGFLTRKNKIEEISLKLEEKKRATTSLQDDIAQLKNKLHSNEEEKEKIQRILDSLFKEEMEKKNEKGYLQKQIEQLQENLKFTQNEIDMTAENLDEIEAKIQHNNKRITELQIEGEKLEGLIQSLQETLAAAKGKRAELSEHITSYKVTLAANEQALKDLSEEIENLQSEEQNVSFGVSQKNNYLQSIQMKQNEIEKQVEQMLKKIEEQKDKVKSLEIEYAKMRFENEERVEEGKSLKQEYKLVLEELEVAKNKYNAGKVRLTKVEMEKEKYEENLYEKYGVNCQQAREISYPSYDRRALMEEISVLKRSIGEIGNVNLNAINEYEECRDRFQFLKQQQYDLIEGKNALNEVIKGIDATMEKNFKQSLVSIQKHFQEIFQQLFGGGHAQLVMTDPENILETGVEINAQPPGKKLQNMNLLSGGEKTLTAISLLFAFLRKRPSPFAVLDEIEAALDDANVDRFADFLKGFAKETQFIIVTHQKKTMEIADALYGVTMQEPGVSQVISLKLTEKVS